MPANISTMTWWQYVQHVSQPDSQAVISEKTGITQANVSRWKTGKQGVDPASARALALAYRRPVIEAFIYAGFLDPDEAKAQVTIERYEDPSDELLLTLLEQRLRRDQQRSDGDDNAAANAQAGGSPVTRLPHVSDDDDMLDSLPDAADDAPDWEQEAEDTERST